MILLGFELELSQFSVLPGQFDGPLSRAPEVAMQGRIQRGGADIRPSLIDADRQCAQAVFATNGHQLSM
jgi:hypothetical protein